MPESKHKYTMWEGTSPDNGKIISRLPGCRCGYGIPAYGSLEGKPESWVVRHIKRAQKAELKAWKKLGLIP